MFWLLFTVLIRVITAVVPDVVTHIDAVSLPNLLDLKDIYDLNSWSPHNHIKLDTGRLIIGKLGGALWSQTPLPTAEDEWTVEFVFRSSGANKDLIFSETNGLSLFIANKPTLNDYSNFGGPDRYDGFQFLLNNKGKQGLKIYANDGTKRFENEMDQAIGNCEFSYLNSQVPFNLRISYSKKQHILKVQLDNNLCFRTDKIQIPKGEYYLGIAGNISPGSEEFFEVLRLNHWDHLTEDAIDDHGLISDGELKVNVKKIVEEKKPEKKEPDFHTPAAIRESLMERNRRHMEEHMRQQQLQNQQQTQEQQDQTEWFNQIIAQNDRISQKLDALERDIKDLQSSGAQAAGDSGSLSELKSTLSNQYEEVLASVAKLNQKLIGEVREHQTTVDALSRKVDLLMDNHKELAYQQTQGSAINTHESTANVIRWILVVIMIVLVVLAVGFYRLRRDVKHSKLL